MSRSLRKVLTSNGSLFFDNLLRSYVSLCEACWRLLGKCVSSGILFNRTLMKKAIWVLILSVSAAGIGAQTIDEVKKKRLETRLVELYLTPTSYYYPSGPQIDALIKKVNDSDLSFDDKFDLRYFLTQLAYAEDIRELPAPTARTREQLFRFIARDSLMKGIRSLVLQNFKREHLPPFLNVQESDIDQPQLNEEYFLVQELLSYHFPKSSRVGEIGGGDGLFSVFLKMMHPEIALIINEVSPERLGEIDNSLLLLNEEEKHRISTVFGTDQSTQMEGEQLDVLIIRNAFHHFADPEAMLESMARSIHPEGKVYLLEQFKEIDPGKNHCSLLKERSFFEDLFYEKGWEKVEEVYLNKQRKHLQVYQLN